MPVISRPNHGKLEQFIEKIVFAGTFMGLNMLINSNAHSKMQAFFSENAKGLPYFEDPTKLVNLNTIYFFLDDDQGFKPSMFHHGKWDY